MNSNAISAYNALQSTMNSYSSISDSTWRELQKISQLLHLPKHFALYPAGQLPTSFAFVYKGLFRVFITDEKGNEYNKNFFDEGSFPGSMSALLKAQASQFTIESLEASVIITIDFKAYRNLLLEADDLKLFHIYYLEKNWLLAKDAREVEIVQQDATQRYRRFLEEYPTISSRIPQYHIASHLGITPTQLSRIRNKS